MKNVLFTVLLLCSSAFGQYGSNFPFAQLLPGTYTVATLPAGAKGQMAIVTDGNPGCASGGGSTVTLCVFGGSTWAAQGATSFPLLAPNGSAAAPSYANSVGNSGMFFSAAGSRTINISSNTTAQFVLDSSLSQLTIPNWNLVVSAGTITATAGGITAGGALTAGGTVSGATFTTASNCASTVGTCGSAASGSVGITNPATTVTVSTTAVTANSVIFVQEDSTLGTKLTATCNTTTGRTYTVTTRTAGTSFVITASATPAANTACLNYWIVN